MAVRYRALIRRLALVLLWAALTGGGWAQERDPVLIRLVTDPPDAQIYTSDGATRICEDARQPFTFDRRKLVVGEHSLPFLTVQIRRGGYTTRRENIDAQILKSGDSVRWPQNDNEVIALAPTLGTRVRVPLGLSALFAAVTAWLWRRQRRLPLTEASAPVEAAAAPWELSDGSRVGGYRVEARLGEGASAVVYRVVANATNERLALKLLKPAEFRGSEVMPRFRREMKALAKLRHPNIPYLAEFGEYRGLAYLVMELLTGESLRDRLRRGPLSSEQAVEVVDQLCSALSFAHGRGVLHRDVKPDNVILDKDGLVRLADFGLARSQDSTTVTAEGALMGTPAYMAPELVQGQRATEKSDQYAMGCLAFELLAGHPPFEGESPLAVAVQQLTSPAPDLSPLAPGAPAALIAAVERMLAKDPSERFANLEDLRQQIKGPKAP